MGKAKGISRKVKANVAGKELLESYNASLGDVLLIVRLWDILSRLRLYK